MTRIHFTAADFAHVRLAPRPAPLQELNAALMTMCRPDQELLFGRWRRRVLRSLPVAAEPLGDLVPATRAPLFLDAFSDSLEEGLEVVRASRPELVRTEIERVYSQGGVPAPLWVRDLHRGDHSAWQVLRRSQQAAFDTAVRPVWGVVQDLHHAEFTRHAVAVAEDGLGAALAALIPGARLLKDVWEFEGPAGDFVLDGRGVLLLPTFHWTGRPVVADLPGRPLTVTYPAGPGLPLVPDGAGGTDDALAAVLGRTRLAALLLLADEHTTSDLARRLRVSNATASAHATALRGAGLITTVRAGRAVLHRRTALGSLLVQRRRRVQESPAGQPTRSAAGRR